MPYFPIVDLASIGPQNPIGGVKAEILTLGGEDEAILPVFTSVGLFWAFVDEYFAEDDLLRPSTFPMDPFRLAEMLEPSGGTRGLSFLVFNPIAVSAGQWRSMKKPIPVEHFCHFMSKIRPGIQQVVRESEARFGPAPPGSAAYKEAMQWSIPQVERLSDNIGAQVDEWWDRPGD